MELLLILGCGLFIMFLDAPWFMDGMILGSFWCRLGIHKRYRDFQGVRMHQPRCRECGKLRKRPTPDRGQVLKFPEKRRWSDDE